MGFTVQIADRMKKILLIMPYGGVGGMERLARTLFDHYKSLGYEVKGLKIIRKDDDIIGFGEDELHLSRIDFSGMPSWKRMLFYLAAPRRIGDIIKTHGFTHSIAFGDMANVFSSLTMTGEFKVASIHSFKSIEFREPNFLNRVFKFALKTSYKNFDKVVCISKAMRDDLVEKCGFPFLDKLEVIYNPHDVKGIREKAKESDDALLAALSKYRVVLFLGRLSTVKAPWHLVNAFRLLQQDFPDARLVFVGVGNPDFVSYVENYIKDAGLTEFAYVVGAKANPYPFLAQAEVMALTSDYEGTPNVIVEAMAVGTPIVTSNCTDGLVELMRINPEPVSPDAEITETESGLITKSLYTGKNGYPESADITEEERIFARALAQVLRSGAYAKTLETNQEKLLAKFDLATAAAAYLEPIKRNG